MNGFTDSDNESPAKIFTEKCCLIDEGVRCGNVAGNASYSKRIQKTVTQRKLKLTIDPLARHIYICDLHKVRIQNARTKRTRKDSDDDEETDNDLFPQDVDLYQLQVNTLRRYKRHYKIATRPGMNKAQLADTIMKHFKTIQLKEKEVIQYFLYMVKTNSNKIDQKNGSSNVSMNDN